MPIIIPHHPTPIRVKAASRVISTTGGTTKVTGYDGRPATGRTILLLGRNMWGKWTVIAETLTDSNGDYTFSSIPSGDNDRYVVVGIGETAFSEYSVAMGDLEAVTP